MMTQAQEIAFYLNYMIAQTVEWRPGDEDSSDHVVIEGSSYIAYLSKHDEGEYAGKGQWIIGRENIITGVWRTANGDGYPDDVDFIDVEVMPFDAKPKDIAEKIARLVCEEGIEKGKKEADIDLAYEQMGEEDRRERNAERFNYLYSLLFVIPDSFFRGI